MADSNITVSGLTATPGVGHTALQWEFVDPHALGLPTLQLDAVEVWAAEVDDHTYAVKVAEGRDSALHMALTEGDTYYYWIKPRNKSGYYGDWHPSSAVAGVQSTVGFAAGYSLINGQISTSVAGNALTVAVKTLSGSDPSEDDPLFVSFRSAGSYSVQKITTAQSLVVPNTATLGVPGNNTGFRVWVVMFDDSGTIRVGLKNCSASGAIFPLVESGAASSSAMSTGADSAGVFYTATAVTDKPFRVIGFLDFNSGLPSIGVWSTDSSTRTLFGPGVKLPGDIIQVAISVLEGVSVNAGAVIPIDDTIPQISEGVQIFSSTITPTSPINILENDARVHCASSGGVLMNLCVALFKGADVDAVRAAGAATYGYGSSEGVKFINLIDRRLAGSASAVTFSVRGGTATGVADFLINGVNGPSSIWGAAMQSSHRITEYMS